MNPFQRARNEAAATRAKLAPGKSGAAIPAKELLSTVEVVLNLAIEPVDPSYADLGGGSAVLQRVQEFIYISSEVEPWGDEFCGLIAHELGHWFLDPTKAPSTVAHLKTLFGSDGSPAVLKVEAYGARERQELQANVFARELLLPRGLARSLAIGGHGPAAIAKALGIPLEFVRQQMLDGMLLPDAPEQVSSLKAPSPDQRAAARAEERAANVVAGPGTGKTTTLIHRVKYLIEEKQVDPSSVLVLTFTNKAAFELVERLRSAGIAEAADIWAGTFHAFGLEFLRKFHQEFELDSDLYVADQLASMTMLAKALPQLDLKFYLRVEDPFDWLGLVIAGISRLKEELVSPAEYRQFVASHPASEDEQQRQREDVATLYEAHERLLAESKSVDFVDLIAKPALALKENRAAFAGIVERFEYVLVDEYQDVTQAMVEFLRQLAPKKSIWVVGDVRQAIHHWRGASLKSLMKFDAEFKAHAGGTTIQRYPLQSNRRSYKEILDLVEVAGRRHVLESDMPLDPTTAVKGGCGELPTLVTCPSKAEMLGTLIENIVALQKRGVLFGRQAVLCRGGSDVQHTAEVLAANGVPVVYIGELAQRPEVKRLLCLMQLLAENQPRALIGLMDVPDLAMPMADFRKLLDAVEDDEMLERGAWLNAPPAGLSAKALDVIARLRKLLGNSRHSSNPWAFVCDMLLENQFALPPHADQSVIAWVQRLALWQFAYAVRNGDGDPTEARLSRYLKRHKLRQRIGDGQSPRELPPEASVLDGVRLLTVHASKGLEFEAVHLAFATSGSFGADVPSWTPPESVLDIVPPEALRSSQAEYDQEAAVERNNLLYVALSRAERHLYVYQETEYGDSSLVEQLKHLPGRLKTSSGSGVVASLAPSTPRKAFSGVTTVDFEHFDRYVMCPLQYWYSQVLKLREETEVDVSMRARRAVMRSLKLIASDPGQSAADRLATAWKEGRLPSPDEDPTLWRDANLALERGIALIGPILQDGGQFAEPTATLNGVTIQMPWGFTVKLSGGTEFAMMRFARRRVSELSTILKPIVPSLALNGYKTMTLNHVLSDKVDDVPGAKRLEWTKSYKSTVRLLDGDNRPTTGRHCARCAFTSMCPSAPTA